MTVLSTVLKGTHAYSLNGVHLIWQNLCDSPNHQIKATAKYTTYTVNGLYQACFWVEVEEIEDDLSKGEGDVTMLLIIVVPIDSTSVCAHV